MGDANLLEGIQNESARLVTGAMKCTNRKCLLKELFWEELKSRRYVHKLTLLYKIINSLSPSYLRDFLPLQVNQRSRFLLRSSENLINIPTNTQRYEKSFFPSIITAWNSLDKDVRDSVTITLFKNKLHSIFYEPKYNKHNNTTISRYGSLLHTRLRLGYCALNFYLYKINVKPTQFCECKWGASN